MPDSSELSKNVKVTKLNIERAAVEVTLASTILFMWPAIGIVIADLMKTPDEEFEYKVVAGVLFILSLLASGGIVVQNDRHKENIKKRKYNLRKK